jgi:hypothetical protein
MPRERRSKYANDAVDNAGLASQLAQKATKAETRLKSVKLEPEDLSETTLGLVTGAGTVNLLTVPQDGSVTKSKLSQDTKDYFLVDWSDTPEVIKDYAYSTPVTSGNTIYGLSFPLPMGKITRLTLDLSASSTKIKILKKLSATEFEVVSSTDIPNTINGVGTYDVDIPLQEEGLYIGVKGVIRFSTGIPGGYGYWDFASDVNSGVISPIGSNLSADFNFGVKVEGIKVQNSFKTYNEVTTIKDDITRIDNELSNIGATNDFPKALNMPHYLPAENIDSNYFTDAYYLGRWTRKTISSTDCMYTINLGSEIFAKVKGTTQVKFKFLNLVTGNPQVIAYSVDGGAYTRKSVDGTDITIIGLDTNEHYIRIVIAGNKDDDAVWSGAQGFAFTGFTVDEGGTVEPVKPKSRIGLFYGDSITAGVKVLGAGTDQSYHAAEQNYVAKCCNLLRADNVRVAFSGVGLTSPAPGGVPNMQSGVIDKMDSTTAEKSDLPDFIVINIGTNDYSVTSEVFQTSLQNFINRIQIKYAGVLIFLMVPFSGTRKTEVQTVANSSANTAFVDTTGWGVTYTDGVHPDLNGSNAAGQKLAEFLNNYFGRSYFMV